MQWETIIGLEVHVQLATQSKIFSGSPTTYGAEPNTQVCAIDLGLPGVLPVLNETAVEMAVKFGLSIDAEVARTCIFARKNYFYPDLPKGYQISQFEDPIVSGGHLNIPMADGSSKRINLTRAHLEEDAGKSLHEDFHGMSGIDLNRTGTPLLEVVSEPELRSAAEAVSYLKTLHSLVKYLEICDGNLQEGSFRCDANVSVRPVGQSEFGTRTEIKNVNSFKFVEKAINYEVERQIEVLEDGGVIHQETRLYDPVADKTRSMRSKEDADDYRYFPDPDLLPVVLSEDLIESVRKTIPELPEAKLARFQTEHQLGAEQASILVNDRALANYFEETLQAAGQNPKLCANWIVAELLGALNKAEQTIEQSPITSTQLAGLIQRIEDNTISGKMAKTVFEAMFQGEGDADTVIEAKGLKQVSDTSVIEPMIDEIIANNPKQVEQYRSGKEKVFGFFVGQVMKASKGQANPKQVNDLLLEKLKP